MAGCRGEGRPAVFVFLALGFSPAFFFLCCSLERQYPGKRQDAALKSGATESYPRIPKAFAYAQITDRSMLSTFVRPVSAMAI
jgi:hypothetical protein